MNARTARLYIVEFSGAAHFGLVREEFDFLAHNGNERNDFADNTIFPKVSNFLDDVQKIVHNYLDLQQSR